MALESRRRRRSRARREVITLQQQITAPDAYGTPVLTGYADVTGLENMRAWFEFTGGTETFRGQQLEANIAGVFEIRKPSVDITPTMILKHVNQTNKLYEIVAVKPVEGAHEGGFRDIHLFVRAYANV